jgi:hypothetical protein
MASFTAFGLSGMNGFGGGWFWRGFGETGMAKITVENTPVGTLVLDIFDTQSKKPKYRYQDLVGRSREEFRKAVKGRSGRVHDAQD